MGLSILEMMRDIEEDLGIEIYEDEEMISTPGQLIDYIQKKQVPARPVNCWSLWAFNRIRKTCVEYGLATRRSFDLDFNFERQIPEEHRREIWGKLVMDSEFPCWPTLCGTRWLFPVSVYFATTLAMFVGIETGRFWGCLAFPVFLVISAVAFRKIIGPNTRIPNWAKSPRHMIEAFTKKHFPKWIQSRRNMSRSEIAAIVRRHVSEYCAEGKYKEDGDFWKDLRIDM